MKKKILVVEDEALIGMMLAHTLNRTGYTVQEVVSNGEEAIIAAEVDPPDVILMDISLPGSLDGIETASKIKAHQDIPIIFFTGYNDKQLIERAEAVRPAAIVDKIGSAEAVIKALSAIFP